MASKEVKQKLQRCLMNRRSFKRAGSEREEANVLELNSPQENPHTPLSSGLKQLGKRDHRCSSTKCQNSSPTAQFYQTPQRWEKSGQTYHQMDRNTNIIGPVEMWIQQPVTHPPRFILVKHAFIEVDPQLAVLQRACVSVRQHRPLHRCQSQPVILTDQPCGFYQCSCFRGPRFTHTQTLPTRVRIIHQEHRHLEEEERMSVQKFIVGENNSMVPQEELCGDSSQLSTSSKQWMCSPELSMTTRSHKPLTNTHSCPIYNNNADSAPDFHSDSAHSTGLMYDPQMLNQQCICGNSSCHAEHAGKIPKVFAWLQECGISNQCKWISGKQCSVDFLHQSSLFALASKTAAGCVTDLLLRVLQGRLKNAFAIVQPHGPGTSHSPASKSVVSPVTIAAENLLKKLNNRKILILDWDVHHCHTTQKMFYKDPNVLHISLHRYGNATPSTTSPGATPISGQVDEVGLGYGDGFNVNVEWSCDLDSPIGDAEYLAAFRTVIRPIAQQFSPEIILISTEFNTAEGHPESQRGPRVSAKCFGLLTRSLMEVSGGRVVLVLERGHDHPSVCEASAACVNALLQNKVESLSDNVLMKKPCAPAVQSLHRVLQIHSQYWSSVTGLTHTVGESWLQAEGKLSSQTDTASALATLTMTTPKHTGDRNEPVEHDENEDETPT